VQIYRVVPITKRGNTRREPNVFC